MSEIDWLALFRRCVARQRELFAGVPGIEARTVYEGRGEGGDMSLAIDRRSEDVIFEELEEAARRGPALLAVSEERGEVALGASEAALRLVIDPIDGSLNARRTIPPFSVSIAVATGESMDTVELGFVHDFGADEEFYVERGASPMLGGTPIPRPPREAGLEVVGLESASPDWIGETVALLEGRAYRLRVVGSIAITLSYVAAGRFDGMLSARPCRSVDAAAAQLMVRESGGAVDFGGLELSGAALDLDARYPVVAARAAEDLPVLVEAQAASAASRP